MSTFRKARVNDYWRTVYKRSYPAFIKKVECRDGLLLDGAELSMAPGINAIAGKNGTGKSHFVRTLFNEMAGEESNRTPYPVFIDSGSTCITLQKGTDVFEFPTDDSQPVSHINEYITTFIFDPCTLIPEIQKLFSEQDNIEELLENFGTIEVNESDLHLANYLCNARYAELRITNIEDEFPDYPRLPFFSVRRDDNVYDSRAMGLGELSLLYLFWLVRVITQRNESTFFIIEEPESFLPPLTQIRLCNVLAKSAADYGISILISTHSEHILERLPRSHIYVMRRTEGTTRFFSASTHFEQMKVLGLSSPKKAILLLEDKAAECFLKAIIRKLSSYATDNFYYHNSGSDGLVVKQLQHLPARFGDLPVLGILDGDCRGRFDDQLENIDNHIFLPTEYAPEEVLMGFFRRATGDISRALSIPMEQLKASIDVADGSDHHDYFFDVSRVLEMDQNVLMANLCDLWVNDPHNEEVATAFASSLDDIVKKLQ